MRKYYHGSQLHSLENRQQLPGVFYMHENVKLTSHNTTWSTLRPRSMQLLTLIVVEFQSLDLSNMDTVFYIRTKQADN